MSALRIGAEVAGWAAVLAGAAGVALHFSPFDARLSVLAAALVPYLLLGAVLAVLLFAGLRSWIGALAGVLVAGVAVWIQAPLFLGESVAGSGPEFTVAQANLLFDGADPAAFVDAMREREVDLLTVNELTPAALDGLAAAELDALLPHRHVSPGRTATGTGIWSRYPLTGAVEFDGFVLNQLGATAEIPGAGPVSVFALHPVPPVYGVDVWADELERLRAIVERAPADRPAVVGGDFNATHDHAQFRRWLTGRFRDAAEQSGAGLLRTYPADRRYPPLIGIDHILLAGGRAHGVAVVALPGADHRALVARVRPSS
ncbi:endonuclease/exonuclease/phosphatase family protein [Nocardia asteroides]|uniref:endonuclease/exonuclease/phosphatase family protein n=1 Tax=Nocardia asteroides TaxID=1824 RepID=UPI001E3B43A7|nr:endonuclease/exonuclease/phosphatase family protein [Nocardia asteroides]UGT63073.1 endonuclease/exonuclease/phosphatase family protein [Nocardia asteroides]